MGKENNQQQVWTLRPKLKQGRRFHNDSKNDAIVYLRRMQIKGTIGNGKWCGKSKYLSVNEYFLVFGNNTTWNCVNISVAFRRARMIYVQRHKETTLWQLQVFILHSEEAWRASVVFEELYLFSYRKIFRVEKDNHQDRDSNITFPRYSHFFFTKRAKSAVFFGTFSSAWRKRVRGPLPSKFPRFLWLQFWGYAPPSKIFPPV